MAVEPLGSMMTIQSQTVQRVANSKPVVENTEVFTPEKSKLDEKILTVPIIDSKEEKNAGADAGVQQQAVNDKIKKAVEQLNKSMPHSEAVFGIHDGTNRVMIKIIDRDTKELIREIPPEETLDMIAKVWELAGILVDEKR